jgi:UDP-N-acetylmuramoyl-tripeptide--D-alanyl-D-alanine ligase
MIASLENFKLIDGTNKVLFLGDMFELGETAHEEHQAIADLSKNLGFTEVHLIGENFFKVDSDFRKHRKFEDLAKHLVNNSPQKSTVLIKGSRGMALERILEYL